MSAAAIGIGRVALADEPAAVRAALDGSEIGAVEIPCPPLDDMACAPFVRALLTRQGFKLALNGMAPDEALAMIGDQLLGRGAFADARAMLARDIAGLAHFAAQVAGGRASVSLRTTFAPGDLVWHVDRVNEPVAFRLLWAPGRPCGMRVTASANIDEAVHAAFMRREHPLLCRLDNRVLATGATLERLWAHRPQQVAAMTSGRFPFLRDPAAEYAVAPGAISIHRVATPAQAGTYHRSDWGNRSAPGLQVVITATAGTA